MLKAFLVVLAVIHLVPRTFSQQPAVPQPAAAQNAVKKVVAPQEVNSAQVSDTIRFVAQALKEGGPSPEFSVEGDKIVEGQILAVGVLTFHPGSRLIFAGATGDRSDRFIVARTIQVLSGDPPSITWKRESAPPPMTPMDGKPSPTGFSGSEGAPGLPGAPGQTGNPGYPGRSAPTVYLFAGKIEGGPILVDLRGQDGGEGGKGQSGGDGGNGGSGRPGISSPFACSAGGQNGGPGGKAGDGGKGGTGGRGGNGGSFILLSSEKSLAVAKDIFRVDVGSGIGGKEGEGGMPGTPGRGGNGGPGSTYCGGGGPGQIGGVGSPGLPGEIGDKGSQGTYSVVPMTSQQRQAAGVQ